MKSRRRRRFKCDEIQNNNTKSEKFSLKLRSSSKFPSNFNLLDDRGSIYSCQGQSVLEKTVSEFKNAGKLHRISDQHFESYVFDDLEKSTQNYSYRTQTPESNFRWKEYCKDDYSNHCTFESTVSDHDGSEASIHYLETFLEKQITDLSFEAT
uniref:Uncharacterized protein n=1 Tax=Romanomermis culicivorax TaxID=13658 RepID=A0A915IX59_ROMCU